MAKKIYMYVCCRFQLGKQIDMIGCRIILFTYFVCNLDTALHFSPFFSIFDYILLRFHKMFRVGTKT